ncbi:PspC domain-containing protein [Dysgonomonas capnocytophagoides]|uniref:PspC domain-containing protein n=1 Tax=Dysgonomonas capnocytophagoides TaxID=45254 RepID=UPI0039921DDA
MKKVVEVNIGGVNFTIEDDAYIQLKAYLARFESTLPADEAKEIMEDIEIRVSELFQKEIKYPNQVVDEKIVDSVIKCLGEVDSSKAQAENKTNSSNTFNQKKMRSEKKLYRNPDDKKIAGVCSGLAEYFNIDVTLMRIIFVVVLFGYGATLLVYIVLWIAMPEAITRSQKMEMRGESVTAENIKNYSGNK